MSVPYTVNVLIERDARWQITEIVDELSKLGMTVERVGVNTGVISGIIPSDETATLIRALPAVKTVARDRTVSAL